MPDDTAQFGPDFSIIDDLVGVLLRRKLIIVLTTLGMLIATYGVLSYLTEQYESQARLLVKLGRENTEVPITVEKGSVFTSGVQEEEVNSYIKLLQSRVLVEAVIDDVGLDAFDFPLPEPTNLFQRIKRTAKEGVRYAKKQFNELLIVMDLKTRLSDREKVLKLIQESLTVRREGKSNVIYLSVKLPGPQLANRTLGSLLTNYFKHHVGLGHPVNMLAIFDSQANWYHDQYETIQKKIADIRATWSLSSVDQQRSELIQRLGDLQSESDKEQVELARVEHERAATAEALKKIPARLVASETVDPNPALLKLKETLVDKRLQRLEVGARYNETLPAVTTVDDAIREVNGMLSSEKPTQPGPVIYTPHPFRLRFEQSMEEFTIQEAGLAASSTVRSNQIGAIRAELHNLDQGADLLRLAELELSVVKDKYLSNAARREQARVDQALDSSGVADVSILSPPNALNEPVFPRKMLIMGVGGFAGLMLGFGLALVVAWTDDTIYSANDLRGPALPIYLGEFRMSV